MSAPDTLYVLLSTALVLLMTPAVAFFYGGLVRSKNVLNTLMMSLASIGVVGLVWAVAGYSLAFAPGNAFIGGLDHLLLRGVDLQLRGTIPHLLFFAFQGTFAIVTAALVSGAVVERMRFPAFLLFIALWTLGVYAPIAHWVWGGGFLGTAGVLDFAGGTVVHITAGVAAVVAALVLGPRKDYGRQALLPHNVPFTVLGASLAAFGWLGFNGGSALAVNGTAVLATVNTILAAAAALAGWLVLDTVRTGKATAVGAATGLVVGLVAITPACGFVSPSGAIAIGLLAVAPSYFAIVARATTRLDDSLDVMGAHGTGGLVGALLTGVFAAQAWGGTAGALEGNVALVGKQALGALAALAWGGLGTFAILRLVAAALPLRATPRDEAEGLDVVAHGEEGYTDGEGAILVLPTVGVQAPATAAGPAPVVAAGAAPARGIA